MTFEPRAMPQPAAADGVNQLVDQLYAQLSMLAKILDSH
jgi:hypothetical protein